MGGLLSMALNVARPGAVRAVVLNDIGPEIVRHGVGRIVDHIAHDHPQPDWDTALAWQKENFHHLRRFTEHDWRVLCEGSFVEGEDGWLHVSWDIRLARAMVADRRSGPSLWPLFLSLRDKPVLTFRGAESDVLTAQGLAAMARAKPDMICRTVDNVGHVPVLDWPECRAEITRFLAALDS